MNGFVAVGVLSVALIGQAQQKNEPKGPNYPLDGVWKVVSAKFGGPFSEPQDIPVDAPDIERIGAIRRGKLTLPSESDRGMWTLEVNTTKNPKELDILGIVDMEDNAKGKSPLKCIYVLEKDTLTVRFHHGVDRIGAPFLTPQVPRPKDFADSVFPSITLTFQRISK
jgi:uncharacterized protein (TIGR03067 family)